MNNKKLGTAFEKEFCEILARKGYWVHFIVPDARGAQPFDIVAVKRSRAMAFDCKTCVSDTFNISRLEENQIMAFEKWMRCQNSTPYIAIKHKGNVYIVPYTRLKEKQSVRIKELSSDEIL